MSEVIAAKSGIFSKVRKLLTAIRPLRAKVRVECDVDDSLQFATFRVSITRKKQEYQLNNLYVLDKKFLMGRLFFKIQRGDKQFIKRLIDYNPVYQDNKGFVISTIEIPEVLNYIRTKASVVQSEIAKNISIDPNPLKLTHDVDYDEQNNLQISSEFRSQDNIDKFEVADVLRADDKKWVQHENRFHKKPDKLDSEFNKLLENNGNAIFKDDEIPEFLSSFLSKIEKNSKASERVKKSKVIELENEFTPKMDVDFDNRGNLVTNLEFKARDKTFSVPELNKIPEHRKYIRKDDTFAKINRDRISGSKLALAHRGFKNMQNVDDGEFVIKDEDLIPNVINRNCENLRLIGHVFVSDRVSKAKIIETEFLPKISVDLDAKGWLWLDIKYMSDKYSFPYVEVNNLNKNKLYLRKGDDFLLIDRQTHNKVTETIKATSLVEEEGRFKTNAERFQDIVSIFNNVGKLEYSENFVDFIQKLRDFQKIEEVSLPHIFEGGHLREYQQHGFNWLAFLKKYGLKGILADDMGLGKTIQTIALVTKLKYDSKRPNRGVICLVVCPTSVVENWVNEFQRFAPMIKVREYTGINRKKVLEKLGLLTEVAITSYNIASRDISILGKIKWDLVVLDEAQKIKNYETTTSKACKMLAADYRLALTGTPVENRLSELWSIFDFIMPGYLRHYKHFRENFEIPIMKYNDKGKLMELSNRVKPFVLRRLKKDVATELPEKIELERYCELTPEQTQLYKQFIKTEGSRLLKDISTNVVSLNNIHIFTAIMRLKQICCHPALILNDYDKIHDRSGKFEAFREIIDEIVENEVVEKTLVFSQFVEMCKIILTYLREKEIKCFYLDGMTRNRQELIDEFNAYPGEAVFVISLRAGGLGLNLQSASNVIHYDRWWNPAVENQATDRAHRIGQTKKVRVFKIHTSGTIDERIDKLQKRKAELFSSVVAADEKLYKEVTKEELEELFTFNG